MLEEVSMYLGLAQVPERFRFRQRILGIRIHRLVVVPDETLLGLFDVDLGRVPHFRRQVL